MSSSEGQRNGFFPAALGFEYQLDDFTGCAFSTAAAGDEVADSGEFGSSVGYTDGEAGALGERDVGQVVAEVGYFFFRDTGEAYAFLESLRFLFLSEVDIRNVKLFGALGDGGRFTAGDEPGLNAHGIGERKTLPVLGIEDFHFGNDGVAGAGDGRGRDEADAAIGEGSVYIHEKELDFAGAG